VTKKVVIKRGATPTHHTATMATTTTTTATTNEDAPPRITTGTPETVGRAVYSEADLDRIGDLLGHRFTTVAGRETLRCAVTPGAYEAEEYCGDAVLQFLVTARQARRGAAHRTPGELTRERMAVVDKGACVEYVKRLGLDAVLKTGALVAGSGLNKVHSDIFEAVLYALYVDFGEYAGMERLAAHFERILGQTVDALAAKPDTNYMAMVQTWAQARFHELPKYIQVPIEDGGDKTSGSSAIPAFLFQVVLPDGDAYLGTPEKSVAKAKRAAAQCAWTARLSKNEPNQLRIDV